MRDIPISFTIPYSDFVLGMLLLVFAVVAYLAISNHRERLKPFIAFMRSPSKYALPLVFLILIPLALIAVYKIFGLIVAPNAWASDKRGLAVLLATVTGAPFVIWRTWIAQKQSYTAEQGHMTDRITKAVEQLGTEKTVWEDGVQQSVPNLEVRLGAIYALERIAQDSLRDHIPVMEILCAYLRNNTPSNEAVSVDTKTTSGLGLAKIDQQLFSIPTARQDIQSIVTVIGRRKPSRISYEQDGSRNQVKSRYNLDLRACNLQNLDFRSLDFSNDLFIDSALDCSDFSSCKLVCSSFNRASLTRSKFTNCELNGSFFKNPNVFETDFSNSDLSEAFFNGKGFNSASFDGADLTKSVAVRTRFINCAFDYSKLRHAHFTHTELNDCDFRKTDFSFSRLDDSDFSDTILSEADFSNACLKHANFSFAVLEGAILDSSTEIEHAVFHLAAVREVDFQKVLNFSQSQVEEMSGDSTTKLPAYLSAPKWTNRQYIDQEFYDTWEAEVTKAKAAANL